MPIRWFIASLMAALPLMGVVTAEEEISPKERERQALNEQQDKLKLRQKREFVEDCAEEFLKAPAVPVEGEFAIAKVPPKVRFQILPDLVPEYFSGAAQYMACWANWAYVARSDDNRFYLAASDHLARGCHANVYEYRPQENQVKRVIDVRRALGWTDDMYTDGKIHGHMGILSDGTLWTATHFGVEPTDEWYAAGYRGSWLLSYNIHTGETKNWGVPLVGNSLPCFSLDTRRGRWVGTGHRKTLLCWDAIQKSVRFAGYPPNGWVWWERAMLCDESTGKFWGMDASEKPYRLMSFDPELNRFERYDLALPENPYTKEQGQLRGATPRPAVDGWFYWAMRNGSFLRFRPAGPKGPEIESLGTTWDKGRDTLQLALSPEGRYVYYQPKGYPSPLVQYDVKTGRKKAIGFLQDYYFDKYGYWLGSEVYGMEISRDGSFVVIVENGTFAGRGRSFGHPAITVVSIPESERPID